MSHRFVSREQIFKYTAKLQLLEMPLPFHDIAVCWSLNFESNWWRALGIVHNMWHLISLTAWSTTYRSATVAEICRQKNNTHV